MHWRSAQQWLIIVFLALPGCAASQALLLDRGLIPDSHTKAIGIDCTGADGSLTGDDFSIGREGETWVIDKIRAWIISPHAFGAQFQTITFLGGLANDQATVECACHNLLPMKRGMLSDEGSGNPDIVVSSTSVANLWQVDFQNFRWSVPGGAKVQFAIHAVPRGLPQPNPEARPLLAATTVQHAHSLRVFSKEGAFKSFLDKKLPSSGESLVIGIQVWGHPAPKAASQP
jgi:hypothetical protein